MLNPARDSIVEQELALAPGNAANPGGVGDNGAHSRGSGASAPPPPPRGHPLQPDAALGRRLPLPRARAPAYHFQGRLGQRV